MLPELLFEPGEDMATYKFHATMRFGKYYGALRKAGEAAPDLTKETPVTSAKLMGDTLEDYLENSDLVEGDDSIIFRDNSFTDFYTLAQYVRLAQY